MKPHKTTLAGSILLLDIPVGRTVSDICPSCGKSKLSVSNLDGTGYLYNCFSASCGLKGYVPLAGVRSFATDAPAQPVRTRTPYTGPLEKLIPRDAEFLENKYAFTEYHLQKSRVRRSHVGLAGRYAFPILDSRGTQKGIQFRSYTGSGPKATTLLEDSNSTKSSWYAASTSSRIEDLDNTVILVEDIPSAVRLSAYVSAIALLGTTIDPRDIPLISAKWAHVVVALDPDATGQALRLRARLAGWFDWVDLLFLNKDFKDMTEHELYDTVMGDVVP